MTRSRRPAPQQFAASDRSRGRSIRATPPPLEANDQAVTAVITAGWAVALAVVLILREQIPPAERWWIWTCLAGLVMGLFGLWYVPRLKRARARSAARRVQAPNG